MSQKQVESNAAPSPIHTPSLPLPPAAGEWAARRERMRLNWRLLPDDLDAALLLGLPDAAPPDDLSPGARRMAQATAGWASTYLGGASDDLLLLRRRLFRAVYCDWPYLDHVLRLLAAHHARLFFGPASDLAIAEQSMRAYASIVQMLGMWRLRRIWLEESVRRTSAEGYGKAVEKLGISPSAGVCADMLEDDLIAGQGEWAGDLAGKLPKGDRFDIDSRMQVFHRLRRELAEALRDEFGDGPAPQLELMPLMPGVTIHYAQSRGFKLDEWLQRLPQLQLRLFCASESDCYRALGVFHRVAIPIRPDNDAGFRDFTDHIARPLPNGYRALQTVCQWPIGAEGRLIRCHILTRAMNDLNDWGIMSVRETSHQPKPGLWRSLEHLTQSLKRRGGEDVITYLRQHDLNDSPDPIYCFTPLGEIVLLKQGSLPLDFAYRIHTQLGHQATRVRVNGREADLKAPLANGDLVKVTFDITGSGFDFDWQGKVKYSSARTRIRAEARRRAGYIHEGRRRLEDGLIRQIGAYRQDAARRGEDVDTALPPLPSTADIDHFARRFALRQGLRDTEQLYQLLQTDGRLVDDLAHRLMSEKIIRALRPTDDQPARVRLAEVELCAACRPTRNPIRVLLRASSREGEVVVVHRPDCRFASSVAPERGLEWAEEDTPDDWPLYRFDVSAPDRDGLLIHLLEIVRAMPNAYLFSVDASVSERGRAYIALDVALRLPQSRGDLKRLLEVTGAQVSYDYLPAESRRSDVRLADLSREIGNPFTRSHVTDWRFFDRDEITSRLTRWVYAEAATSPLMLVYGQRRVGKSSLVNRFFEKERLVEFPDHEVVPVFVDFRLPDLSRPETVADSLGRHISARLGLDYDRPRPGEDPMVWLDGLLLAAQARLRDHRLLLIIDEFDADLDRLLAGGGRPRSLAALRAIMSTHPFIRWLLVVQDVYLADPQIQAALPDLPYSFTQLEVRHLDRPHARDLIRTLTTQSGYRLEPAAGQADLFDQVVDWTAGNPFFVHLLGREMLNSADAGGRKHITQADFFQAVNVVLGRDGEFNHFTEHLTPDSPRRAVTALVAAACEPGQSLPLAAVVDELAGRRNLMSEETARRTIDTLERLGVLAITRDAGSNHVGIPIRLFHQWLRVTWGSA